MKKIFLTCLGVCLTSVVPAIADDWTTGIQRGFACSYCMGAANEFRKFLAYQGVDSCQALEDNPSIADNYNEIKQKHIEAIQYDANQYNKTAEGEVLVNHIDAIAQESCSGLPAAVTCQYYGFCLCEANYYPYISSENIDNTTEVIQYFVCFNCPDGGQSQAGARSINACYVPAGTGGTDSSGTWEYTSNCYYSN